ncbi:hypothetical protein OAD30_03055 [Alphaproteobacteria bacterium]|nr:hypothetical protein [Alphaproteobacteria bacterium]
MFNLIRISLLSVLISTSFIGTKSVFALSATSMTMCSDTGNLISAAAGGAQGYCRFTPLKYEVAIYEMGVCTADPMTGTEFNRALCSTTFTATDTTNGDVQDMVETLDGTISLNGTSTRPAPGTYGFPYVIIGNTVTVRGEFENSGTTYYGLANGNVNTTGPSADVASALKTFGPTSACDGTYTGASATNGTIDAYLTDTALDKKLGVGDYNGSDGCNGITRLVGLMKLNTPITITSNTLQFKFIFNIRNFGSQFIETGGNNIPDLISQGPFGGFFETVEGAAQ